MPQEKPKFTIDKLPKHPLAIKIVKIVILVLLSVVILLGGYVYYTQAYKPQEIEKELYKVKTPSDRLFPPIPTEK